VNVINREGRKNKAMPCNTRITSEKRKKARKGRKEGIKSEIGVKSD